VTGRRGGLALLLVLGAAAPPAQQSSTPRRSQRAALMQMVGQTKIEILYSRPVARGRELFGALVPWGRVWNPGADTATQITVSTDVLVNGQRLAAGTYSLWAIPGQDVWTVILNRAAPVWHLPYPGEEKDALRVRVVPQRGEHMETLAFHFPVVDGSRAVLHLQWGTTIVPLEIQVNGK
jgi:hypothetical protein